MNGTPGRVGALASFGRGGGGPRNTPNTRTKAGRPGTVLSRVWRGSQYDQLRLFAKEIRLPRSGDSGGAKDAPVKRRWTPMNAAKAASIPFGGFGRDGEVRPARGRG